MKTFDRVEALCARPLAGPDAAEFFSRRAEFRELIAEDPIRELAHEAVRAMVEPPHLLPGNCSSAVWTVRAGEGCAFRLERLPREPFDNGVHLEGSPSHRMIALISGDHAKLDHYRHESGQAEIFDRRLALPPCTTRALDERQIIELEAWRDVAEWQPVEKTQFAATLLSGNIYSQFWVYDRDTSRPREAVSATFGANRLIYAMELLVELGHHAAAEVVAGLYRHPAHFVRWAVIRAALDLDETIGREVLSRAVDDPHPHVARAAAAGLKALDG